MRHDTTASPVPHEPSVPHDTHEPLVPHGTSVPLESPGVHDAPDTPEPLDALVRRFIELAPLRTKRGRAKERASLEAQIEALTKRCRSPATSPERRIALARRVEALRSELAAADVAAEYQAAKAAFIAHAAAYGAAHGITYDMWLTLGISPRILAEAGIHRTSRTPRSTR